MGRLEVRLLGPFQVILEGAPVAGFHSDKVRALLAYLCTERAGPHRREKLAGLLWPDLPESSARANLRRALADLRSVISDHDAAPPFLSITPQTIEVGTASDAWVDVVAFADLAGGGGHESGLDPSDLERAVALYRGEFLEGFSLPDSSLFEEWVLFNRERWHRLVLEALQRLVQHCQQSVELERGLGHAWRQVELDPWREEAHRQLMLLLAVSGQRSAALAQYETCRQVLAEELGTEPSAGLQEIYQLLLKDEPLPDALFALAQETRKPRQVGSCPYRGLAAFQEEDAPFFFGREAFTQRLAEAVQQQPMVAVIVGSSGCGKSSAVFAGLLPPLRDSGDWLVADLRPGADPFRALANALLPILSPELDDTDHLLRAREMADALLAGDLSLADVAALLLQRRPRAQRLLLVVDQFEELYTLCPEPEMRRRLVDTLLEAVAAAGSEQRPRLVLLLTMRADFMGQALAHRPFADALQEATMMLGPMNRDELRAAIEAPAGMQGAAFESGLVERILDDVGEEPGNLPLLEFALTLLWGRHSHGWLTHVGYEAIGRVEGALALHASEVYTRLDEVEQESARQVFVQLVHPGEGTEDTRRMATRAEVGEENWGLVQHLADKRLVVTGRDASGVETVEVVHEALIQGWGQLLTWMEEYRAFRTWQERLRAALRQWEATGQDEGALLRGAPLVEAEGWLTERGSELSESEKALIRAALALREQRAVQRETRRQQELESARALAAEQEKRADVERRRAEEQARSAGRLRQRALLLAGTVVVAVILAAVAFLAFRQADQNAHTAQVASTQAVSGQNAAETAQALEADQRATAEAEGWARATQQAVAEAEVRARATQQAVAEAEAEARATAQAVAEVAESDALKQAGIGLASQGQLEMLGPNPERAVLLGLEAVEHYPYTWQAEYALAQATLNHKLVFDLPHRGEEVNAELSSDGSRILTSGNNGLVKVWDASTGDELLSFAAYEFSEAHGTEAHWSPSGDRILTAAVPGGPRVWDASSGTLLFDLSAYGHQAAGWSPDGTRITTFGLTADSEPRVWDASTGEELFALPAPAAPESRMIVHWSPDGRRILTEDGGIWDGATGEKLAGLPVEVGATYGGIGWPWSPDGQRIVTSSVGEPGRIWDATTGEEILVFERPAGGGFARWSPAGDRILTLDGGVGKGLAQVWDAVTGAELFQLQGVTVGSWSPDGQYLVTDGEVGEARVWAVATGSVRLSFNAHSGSVYPGQWFASGDHFITASQDGTAKVWDASQALFPLGCQPSCPDSLFGGWYTPAAWSPDGQQIARGFSDGTVTVWDMATGDELLSAQYEPLAQHIYANFVVDLSWSPEGDRLLVSGGDAVVRVWDAMSGHELLRLPAVADQVESAAWSPDGTRIVTANQSGPIRVWNATTGEILVAFAEGQPYAVSWSSDGSRIVIADVASTGGGARVRAASTGEMLLDLFPEDFQFGIGAVAYSPDGTRIVAFGEDGLGRVFDANSGEELLTFPGVVGAWGGATWSPSGDRFLIGGSGGTVKMFDATTGNEIVNFDIGAPAFASWSPNGKQIAISDWNGNLSIYPAWQSLEELIDYAKDCCVFRQLTPEEREQFGLPPQ